MPDTAGERTVLKGDEVFLVCDAGGDIGPALAGAGLYLRDMRYLSLYTLTIDGAPPALLYANAERLSLGLMRGSVRAARVARDDGELILPQTIGVARRRIVAGGLREEIELRNYNDFPAPLRLTLALAADFRDMFEVRGFRRSRVGRVVPPAIAAGGRRVILGYRGPDARVLETEIALGRAPARHAIRGGAEFAAAREPVGDELLLLLPPRERRGGPRAPGRRPPIVELEYAITLPPGGTERLDVTVTPRQLGPAPRAVPFAAAAEEAEARYTDWAAAGTAVATDNPQFDAFLERGARDIHALLTSFPGGRLLAAGLPWYVAPFGRDSLIAAYQTLLLQPALAADTLRYLAKFQGHTVDPWRDAEPGKILHEMRVGEMSHLGEIPHTPYYGTIDATLLYVMLFAATVRWTGDDALFRELLPVVRRCLEWADRHGDRDGDGYVEYASASPRGITNQGWKDSGDSILWPDGRQPAGPIALIEVQGYLYAAKRWLAEILAARGEGDWAARLAAEAAALKERFNRDFWRPDAGAFGMGLDGAKRLVPASGSNPGHALLCGIVARERAGPLVARLLAPDLACGWGIRTLSADEPQYNPMSYHNGTVWPHDNALIVAGMRRYGFATAANRIIGELFDAAKTFPSLRLPELYCGFPRGRAFDAAPAEYPVSCSPQAWAAGTPFLCLQTILGLAPGPGPGELTVDPLLPPWLNEIRLRGLRVGAARVDLLVRRADDDGRATTELLGPPGGVRLRRGTSGHE